MDTLNLSENIIRLRRGKKITQEELANFLGVTKASVSKWENRQSMPDILLLPRLAAFFDVTVDELLGYSPQLSVEQIRKIYSELAADFAQKPFEEVMEKSQKLIKMHYSCYPFLLQICILYLNHFSFAPDDGLKQKMSLYALKLCDRIIENCKTTVIYNDAISIRAMLNLQLGKVEDVIEELEEVTDPCHLSQQNDALLIQAFLLSGDTKKASSHSQIAIYLHLLSLIAISTQYLNASSNNFSVCEETIKRIDEVIKTYYVTELHPNLSVQFYYQSALTYAMHKEHEKTLLMLNQCCDCIFRLFDNFNLHGDSYFSSLDDWIERLELGSNPPRDKKSVSADVMTIFEHPLFAELSNNENFIKIKNTFRKGMKRYEHE